MSRAHLSPDAKTHTVTTLRALWNSNIFQKSQPCKTRSPESQPSAKSVKPIYDINRTNAKQWLIYLITLETANNCREYLMQAAGTLVTHSWREFPLQGNQWKSTSCLTNSRSREKQYSHKSHSQTDPHAYQHHIIPPIMPITKTTTRTTWVSRYQKGKTSLDLNEARAGGVLEYSDISWTICKQSAPRSRQITTPTPHQSILQAGCSSWCPTNSQITEGITIMTSGQNCFKAKLHRRGTVLDVTCSVVGVGWHLGWLQKWLDPSNHVLNGGSTLT